MWFDRPQGEHMQQQAESRLSAMSISGLFALCVGGRNYSSCLLSESDSAVVLWFQEKMSVF